MPQLERWHQEVAGQVADVSFPRLKKLDISKCPRLASIPKMLPLLEDLRVKEARDIPLHHLINLSVQSNLECKGSISGESAVGWLPIDLHFSRLGDSDMKLTLGGLTENVERFEEELKRIPGRFIKNLVIEFCDCLFSSEPSQIQRNIWTHFGSVERMWIRGIRNIVQWPAAELRNLNRLRVLRLFECSSLSGSLPSTISDDENVLPPRLQELRIERCENLVEVPKWPASLEKLRIAYCPKLVSMPTILGNIKKIPDGMYGVTALKKLEIELCPRVEALSDGLLQQLPTLEKLRIRGCPNLEEAFSRGGAYWNLVEAIPQRYVGAQDGPMR